MAKQGHHSSKAIIAALIANGLVAIIKLIAAILSGSKAMLAEAIHSFADTGNQLLLLIGEKSSKKIADKQFNFGYGKEQFFWSMMVGVLLFGLGGVYAIYEGIHKIQEPSSISHGFLVLGVLGVAIIIEGFSLRIAYNEYKASTSKPLKTFIKETSNSSLIVVLLEDSAAILGLLIAFIGTILALYVHPIFDGIASLSIGILLGVVSFVLIYEVKKLLVGESASKETHEEIKCFINDKFSLSCVSVKSMYIGNEKALFGMEIDFEDHLKTNQIEKQIEDLEKTLKENFKIISVLFIQPKDKNQKIENVL